MSSNETEWIQSNEASQMNPIDKHPEMLAGRCCPANRWEPNCHTQEGGETKFEKLTAIDTHLFKVLARRRNVVVRVVVVTRVVEVVERHFGSSFTVSRFARRTDFVDGVRGVRWMKRSDWKLDRSCLALNWIEAEADRSWSTARFFWANCVVRWSVSWTSSVALNFRCEEISSFEFKLEVVVWKPKVTVHFSTSRDKLPFEVERDSWLNLADVG